MLPLRRSRIFLLVAVFGSRVATAQETGGNLSGRVISSSAGPVAAAQIRTVGPNLQGSRTSVANRDGFFQLLSLPPGLYTLRVTAIGYRPLVIQDAFVQLGRTAGLGELLLEPLTVELGEVTISAPRLTIDPVRTTIGATLEAKDLAALPGERDYKSLIAILPHVNTSYHGDPVNAGGSTGLENVYFIDGVNVTETVSGISGTSLPYNFVRAVEVKVGGYEAQYGRALGAVVNAVTYSGTNEHEANVFAFLTHDALAASPRAEPNLRTASSLSYDVGARVGGPLIRDRLWYSAAYNPRVENADKEIPGHGLFVDRQIAHVFATKVTWQTAPRANIELSFFGDPTVRHQVEAPFQALAGATIFNPDPFLRRVESGGVIASLRGGMDVGSRTRLDAALSGSSAHKSSLAETDIGGTRSEYLDLVPPGAIEGGLGKPLVSEIKEGRAASWIRGTTTLAKHTLVAGAEYEDARAFVTGFTPGIGEIERTAFNTWVVDSEFSAGTFHNRVPTAYLQDAWRITDRLTASLGVRWSAQFLKGASGRTAQRFPNEWQPRLGFSWQLDRANKQRVFGSLGRFFQQDPLNLTSLFYVDFYQGFKTYSADPRQPGAPLVKGGTFVFYEKDVTPTDNLEVEHFDEATLGYDRLLGSAARFTVRGIRRELRSSSQFGLDDSGNFVIGTPGRGSFDFLPAPRREYTALEVDAEGAWRQLKFRTSYVLSRTWGNYTGLFGSDAGTANPGGNFAFFASDQAANSSGLLPNDRTHVLKFAGSYRAAVGLTLGSFFSWQSGTPLNEFAPGRAIDIQTPVFLIPRGSAGRTPSIYDLNLRCTYDLPWSSKNRRLMLDVFHVGNPRTAVRLNEFVFLGTTSALILNPQYRQPVAFQPPMTARLGVEVGF